MFWYVIHSLNLDCKELLVNFILNQMERVCQHKSLEWPGSLKERTNTLPLCTFVQLNYSIKITGKNGLNLPVIVNYTTLIQSSKHELMDTYHHQFYH